jgi:hypothetical protein
MGKSDTPRTGPAAAAGLHLSGSPETGLQVNGIPDAVKLVRVDGPKARRLADLALHGSDLRFALESLEAIDQYPDSEETIRSALWRTSITLLIKCFGDPGARFQLDASRVYQNCSAELLEAFELFKSLRNKQFIHDENAYTQCPIAAALNDGTKSYKVERIVSIAHRFEVLTPPNVKNLRLLITQALTWIGQQYDKCAAMIHAELEQAQYSELAALPSVSVRAPTADEAHKAR